MQKYLSHLLLCVPLLTAMDAGAQGCSDAGVCTAGPIGELHLGADTTAHADSTRHYARLGFSYAVGEQQTTILIAMAELGFGITDRLSVSLRLPYQSADGDLGSNSGVGDPVLTTSYAFIQDDQRRLDGMVGVKLPANAADATVNERPLPMPYQTSLGTTDLLFGVNYRFHRFSTAVAFQLPVDQGNANQFTHAAWLLEPAAMAYFESAFLERAPDAVVRFQYAIPVGRLTVQPGLLAIQHLGQDTRLEAEPDPVGAPVLPSRVKVDGSEGLTLNLTLDAGYRINRRWSAELAYGSPLIVREERPDGLTRSMVLNLGLAYRFGK